jgi:hypothetical protein
MLPTRTQLSLFVGGDEAGPLEAARRVLDPVQYGLIRAHVTLCREDEVTSLTDAELEERVARARVGPLVLAFGRPEPFYEHGILLTCSRGEADFHALRRLILGPGRVRQHAPHITLAHPRNPKAAGNDLSVALALPLPIVVAFSSLHLIRQRGGEPWCVERVLSLPAAT